MARIACLFVPDFPLAAVHRSEPDLRGRPLALTDRHDPRAPLLAVSPEAEARGVRRGFSAAQARAVLDSLAIRVVSTGCLRESAEALADVADSFSPRVECREGGVVHLDVDHLSSLFGTETHLATSLSARARRVGLEARVAVASSKTAALLTARSTAGIEVIPPGGEPERLSPLPLAALDPPDDLALTLERWGIRTLGDLVRLAPAAVAGRLGAAALRLWRRAAGEDDEPLSPRSRPLRFEESVDCEYAVDSFEPLSFLLRAALERLVARLDVRGLRAGDLELALGLETGGREHRTVRVAAPTADVKVLLTLVRVSFECRPPRSPVESFRLAAVPERLRPVALGLFAPAGPAPEELDAALARLAAVAGEGRIGSPRVVDSHRPEAFVMERFAPYQTSPAKGNGAGFAVLALRVFRPPAPIYVSSDRGHPDFVRSEAKGRIPPIHGRVVTAGGPWRLHGEWWREQPLARDYFDVELSDGCVYRIYREHASGEWYAAGVYD